MQMQRMLVITEAIVDMELSELADGEKQIVFMISESETERRARREK